MGRTLYLCENSRNIQILRDGPSICIRECNRADARIPARRIGRVFIIGNIEIETSVITLFSEFGVPVIFMSRLAEEVACAVPANNALPVHYLYQRQFCMDYAAQMKFIRWANDFNMALQQSIYKRLYHALATDICMGIDRGAYEELITYLKPADAMKWSAVRQFVNMLFKGVAIEELIKAEIDPHIGILRQNDRYGLAADICDIIQPEVDFQTLGFFSSKVEMPCGNRRFNSSMLTEQAVSSIVRRFENARLQTQRLIAALIKELIAVMGGSRI